MGAKSLALCIPAYNAAVYLERLLKSAREQLIPFDEILVYNDCSTDNTSEVAIRNGATVIEGDVNRGCSAGKNRLADVAKSEWLHFHDADDDLLENFTTIAHKWIDKENAPDVILMHYHYVDFDSGSFISQPEYNILDLKKDTIKFSIINKLVNFAVLKKSTFLRIGGFNTDPKVLYNEDRAFYTKASIEGLQFEYEPELACINYFYPKSMSAGNKAKCAAATLEVWKSVIDKTSGKYKKEIAEKLYENATYAASAKSWQTMYDSLLLAQKICPSYSPSGSKFFRTLYRVTGNHAFMIRELVIRNLTTKRKSE